MNALASFHPFPTGCIERMIVQEVKVNLVIFTLYTTDGIAYTIKENLFRFCLEVIVQMIEKFKEMLMWHPKVDCWGIEPVIEIMVNDTGAAVVGKNGKVLV